MINRIMKRFALSHEGAKGLVTATIACIAADIALMLPVGILYFLVNDFLNGAVPENHYALYIIGIAAALLLIFLTEFWKYNATYFSTYRESGECRIRLAEKLRRLPLSFFGKKDLADLTNTILGDVATTEQMFSHYVPQFYGSVISTCIIAVSLFFYDRRLALAALWVLPVALVIVGVSKKAQNYFNRKQNEAMITVQDGVQECLETIRDLKSNNAESNYLSGLYKKIDSLEGRHIKSELGGAIFVVPAQMILKLGIATTALVGGTLLADGTVSLITFFMFLLVVSRIYEPMAFALQNLAALNSLQINIDRMNEIENFKEQGGKNQFAPKGYNITFENVGFAYNDEESVLENVSFTAKQGEVTALIGPSGGGKSTAAKLAARFWDADNGKITVSGTDVRSVDPEQLLTAFSIVFQDVTLFNNTDSTQSSAVEAAQELGGIFPQIAGENGTTYRNLFEVILDDKYDDYWNEKSASIVGEEAAAESSEALKNHISSDIYGQEAVDTYAESGGASFDCWYINDAMTFEFKGDQITSTLTDGTSSTHTYEYLGVYKIGEGETMEYGGQTIDPSFECDVYKSTDDAGEFTYFFLRDDTMEETYHIEFRYGSDLEELQGYFIGKYAYWLSAGIDANADEDTIHNVIDLFITENLSGTADTAAESDIGSTDKMYESADQ